MAGREQRSLCSESIGVDRVKHVQEVAVASLSFEELSLLAWCISTGWACAVCCTGTLSSGWGAQL
jgi:hypothetical protein